MKVVEEIEAADQALDGARKEFERTIRDEHTITADELGEARNRRDKLWMLVKPSTLRTVRSPTRARLEHAEDLDDLPRRSKLRCSMPTTRLSKRFDNAEAVGRLAEKSLSIAAQEEKLSMLHAQAKALEQEGKKLAADWQGIWAGACL